LVAFLPGIINSKTTKAKGVQLLYNVRLPLNLP